MAALDDNKDLEKMEEPRELSSPPSATTKTISFAAV
jgi:hypothetical protein